MLWGWHDASWGGMLLMMLLMLVFWGGLFIVAGLAFWGLVRSRPGAAAPRSTTAMARQTLHERYSPGALTREPYEPIRGGFF